MRGDRPDIELRRTTPVVASKNDAPYYALSRCTPPCTFVGITSPSQDVVDGNAPQREQRSPAAQQAPRRCRSQSCRRNTMQQTTRHPTDRDECQNLGLKEKTSSLEQNLAHHIR